MSGLEIVTLGCRLNLVESEAIRRAAARAGLADAVIVNTCAVTAEAERQARQAIRRARRERPSARVIVTGCAAQIAPERYAAMPEVDRVLGNLAKLDAASYGADAPRLALDDIAAARAVRTHPVDVIAGHARGFVEIQQGCDHRCTYCVIPMGRGPNRSVPMGAVVEQLRGLAARGIREAVLTGVDIASYGADLPGRPRLGELVRRALALVPDLPRLRLSTLDPAAIDNDLWRLLAVEPRLMPHLHLSIQAGCDLVLKRMKRRHSRAEALALCRRARALRPDIVLGADLIAGFPTETAQMFERTHAFIAEAGLDLLHVFPFSPRPGTPAARMPQLPRPVIYERAARLRAAGDAARRSALARYLGRRVAVLAEQTRFGHSEHFLPVRLAADAVRGTIATVAVAGIGGDALLAAAAP